MFANANPNMLSTYDFSVLGFPPPAAFLAAPNETHFMLDLETLALSPDAAITEIGCVNMNTGKAFHCHVIDNYGKRDPGTIAWRSENQLGWKIIVGAEDDCYLLYVALSMFFDWLQLQTVAAPNDLDTVLQATKEGTVKTIVMWCKGTDFDNVITTAAAKSVDLTVPWKYNNFFDVRTLLKLFPQFKIPKEQVTHNALEDAILQAGQLLRIAAEFSSIKRHAGE